MGYDLLSGVLRSVSDSLENVTGVGRGAATSLSDGFSRVGTAAMGLGTVMMAASGAIVGGMVASAHATADFQSQMVLLQTHAGASVNDMKVLSAYILKVAGELGFNPDSLAEAVYHVQSSLTSLPKAMQTVQTDEEVLYRAAQLAAIGHADLEDSVNAVTKAFVAYQKDGYTAQQVTAIFNKTVGEGNMRLKDLNSAFSTGLLPVAEQAGIKLESVGAALATMTDLGIPATRAATYLRSAIIQMSIPSGPAADALKAIGVATNEAKSQVDAFSQVLVKAGIVQTDVSKELQKTGSLGDTLTWLNKKLVSTGMSSKDAAALLEKAFGGIRSGTGIVTLYNNLEGLVQKEKDATDATADWTHTWATFTGQDPNFQVAQLKSSWDALVIVLGYSFLPILLKVVQTVTPLIQNLGLWIAQNTNLVTSVVEGAVGFLAIGGAITFVSGVLGKIIGFVIPIVQFFMELGGALEVVALGADATGASVGTFGGVLASAFGGPIGIAIVAIGALIAIGVLLVNHWNEVKAVAQQVWGYIAPYVMEAVNEIRSIIQSELGFILSIWREHHAQFMAVATVVWTAIKIWFIGSLVVMAAIIGIVVIVVFTLVAALIGLGAGILWVAGKFADLIGAIASFIGRAWDSLVAFFNNLLRQVEHAWSVFASRPAYWLGFLLASIVRWAIDTQHSLAVFAINIVSQAEAAWFNFRKAALDVLSGIPGMISQFMSQAPGIVSNFLSSAASAAGRETGVLFWNIANTLADLPGRMYGIGQDIVRGIWNGIKSMTGWIYGLAKEWVKDLVQGMKDGIISGSPSLLASSELGVPISQGIAHGFMLDMPKTQSILNSSIYNLVTNMSPGSISAPPLNIENHSHVYLDGQLITSRMEKVADDRVARMTNRT